MKTAFFIFLPIMSCPLFKKKPHIFKGSQAKLKKNLIEQTAVSKLPLFCRSVIMTLIQSSSKEPASVNVDLLLILLQICIRLNVFLAYSAQ